MPTIFTAQNGTVIHQQTKITVQGCAAKGRKASHTKKHRAKGRKKRGKGARRR